MATIEDRRFAHVEQRAAYYRTTVEAEADPIMESHNAALLCFEFADIVIQGCDIYGSITQLDEDWRMLVFKGEAEYCPQFERRLEELYTKWLKTSRRALVLYERLDSEYRGRGFDTDGVETLRSYCREAEGILTEDARFFSHPKIFDLGQAALDEHRRSETFEMNG